ncbi:GrpB-like predicted nucleotidyltransferase (UPF0157 family) [Pantoea piersonii]|jgi:GrpB-like predicted nucleotidyltransferase (UPF0157 family)
MPERNCASLFLPKVDVVASCNFNRYALELCVENFMPKEEVFMRTIAVMPYDEKWPEAFKVERLLLQTFLGGVAKNVHHIGSTSVPGLPAKPVIDILLEVSDVTELDKYNAIMVRAGYVARGENGIPGRRYFIKGSDVRSHQVHAFTVGNKEILRHLAFRDYLRKNRDIALDYAEIKRTAAFFCKNDVHRYSALKANFIEHHLQLALIDLK